MRYFGHLKTQGWQGLNHYMKEHPFGTVLIAVVALHLTWRVWTEGSPEWYSWRPRSNRLRKGKGDK